MIKDVLILFIPSLTLVSINLLLGPGQGGPGPIPAGPGRPGPGGPNPTVGPEEDRRPGREEERPRLGGLRGRDGRPERNEPRMVLPPLPVQWYTRLEDILLGVRIKELSEILQDWKDDEVDYDKDDVRQFIYSCYMLMP